MLNGLVPFPSEFFPFSTANLFFLISVPLTFAGWLVAYVGFIRLGFKEKTYGIPILALCGNLGWEITFSNLFFPEYIAIYLGQCMWALFDVLIFVTIWKYAANEFSDPLMKRWVRPFAVLGVFIAIVLATTYGFRLNDPGGYLLGWILAFAQSLMMIAMLLQRGDVRGQSVYIGLGIVVGNISAAVWTANFPVAQGLPPVLDPTVNWVFCFVTVPFNMLYVALYLRQARLQGIAPWKRF